MSHTWKIVKNLISGPILAHLVGSLAQQFRFGQFYL